VRARRGVASALTGGLLLVLGGAAGAGAAPTAAHSTKQVTKVFTTLFNANDKNLAAREALIQDAPKYKTKFTALFKSAVAKANPTVAKVTAVTFPSSAACRAAVKVATCAAVTYDLDTATTGASLLTGRSGYAVYVGRHWLVADVSFCTLAKLAGSSC
jgi:hypothetical protein